MISFVRIIGGRNSNASSCFNNARVTGRLGAVFATWYLPVSALGLLYLGDGGKWCTPSSEGWPSRSRSSWWRRQEVITFTKLPPSLSPLTKPTAVCTSMSVRVCARVCACVWLVDLGRCENVCIDCYSFTALHSLGYKLIYQMVVEIYNNLLINFLADNNTISFT